MQVLLRLPRESVKILTMSRPGSMETTFRRAAKALTHHPRNEQAVVPAVEQHVHDVDNSHLPFVLQHLPTTARYTADMRAADILLLRTKWVEFMARDDLSPGDLQRLAIVLGITIDKQRLEEGLSTGNIALRSEVKVETTPLQRAAIREALLGPDHAALPDMLEHPQLAAPGVTTATAKAKAKIKRSRAGS